MMAISIAKTCSCWYSLQNMLCWQIICSFYWLKTKGRTNCLQIKRKWFHPTYLNQN